MKKKLLTMLAVITAIATLAACGSEETNNDITPTPTTTAAVQNESNASEPAPTEASSETTPEPTEVPALTWENSGLEVEIIEYDRFEYGNTMKIAIVTNTSENTYVIDHSQIMILPVGTTYYPEEDGNVGSKIANFEHIESYRAPMDSDYGSSWISTTLEPVSQNIKEDGIELVFNNATHTNGIVLLFDDNGVVGTYWGNYADENGIVTNIIPNSYKEHYNWTTAKLVVLEPQWETLN